MTAAPHIRTSNQIIRRPCRLLPTRSGHCLLTTDPNTLNSNTPSENDRHGITGNMCIASICIGTVGAAVTITAWMWLPAASKWVKLGADSTEYSKQFDANTVTGFSVPEGVSIYLQASANVDEVYVDFPYSNDPSVAAA